MPNKPSMGTRLTPPRPGAKADHARQRRSSSATHRSDPAPATPTLPPTRSRQRLRLPNHKWALSEYRCNLIDGLGIAYSAKGSHNQAIKDFTEAIHLRPDHAWAYNNRCWSYGIMHRAEEALDDCDKALRLLPDQPEILDSRALAYWLLDDKDKARQDLERAHQLDPSSPTWEERSREFEEMF